MPEGKFQGKANKWGVHPPGSMDDELRRNIQRAISMDASTEDMSKILRNKKGQDMLAQELAIAELSETRPMPYNADGSHKKSPTKQDWAAYHLRNGTKKRVAKSGAKGGAAIGAAAAGGGGG